MTAKQAKKHLKTDRLSKKHRKISIVKSMVFTELEKRGICTPTASRRVEVWSMTFSLGVDQILRVVWDRRRRLMKSINLKCN